MSLKYYPGLNCYLASVVNIADLLKVNYLDAFSCLWSETNFNDAKEFNIYTSKRVLTGFEEIGIRTQSLNCDEMKKNGSLELISDGEFLVIGMDIFDIPWHPIFGHFHDSHYFFGYKESSESILCSDPVYSAQDIRLSPSDILVSAFEIIRIYNVPAPPRRNELEREAKAALSLLPCAREAILAEIKKCGGDGKKNIGLLIKQIIAMVNNRHLFQRFFRSKAISGCEHFFSEAYILKWESIKNGLYKASIVSDNKDVLDEVCTLLTDVINEEIAMAKEILRKLK